MEISFLDQQLTVNIGNPNVVAVSIGSKWNKWIKLASKANDCVPFILFVIIFIFCSFSSRSRLRRKIECVGNNCSESGT